MAGEMSASGVLRWPFGGTPPSARSLDVFLREPQPGVHVVYDFPHAVGRRLGRALPAPRQCRKLLKLVGEFPEAVLFEQLHDVDHEPPKLGKEDGARRLKASPTHEAPATPRRHLFHNGTHAIPLALDLIQDGELSPGLRAERTTGHRLASS